MIKSIDLLEIENNLFLREWALRQPRPKLDYDPEWPQEVTDKQADVVRISEATIMLWPTTNFTTGTFTAKVYRSAGPEQERYNFEFGRTSDLRSEHSLVWDLVRTDSQQAGLEARRCCFYEPNNRAKITREFAHFEIVKEGQPIWACLCVGSWIIEQRIYSVETGFGQGTRITAAWRRRKNIDQWWRDNI